jgi:uncharacterized protein (DUF697 family)
MDSWTTYRETLERIRGGELEHASAEAKASTASQLIRMASAVATVSTMQPLPFVDIVLLTPMQVRMVQDIGLIHGYRLDEKTVRQTFRPALPRILACQAKIALSKCIPVPAIPGAYADTVAYALTHAIGEASDRYFLLQRTTAPDQMKPRFEAIYRGTFERAFRLKRDEMKATFRSPEVRRQVKELKKAQRAGKIDEGEEARRMDAILG